MDRTAGPAAVHVFELTRLRLQQLPLFYPGIYSNIPTSAACSSWIRYFNYYTRALLKDPKYSTFIRVSVWRGSTACQAWSPPRLTLTPRDPH